MLVPVRASPGTPPSPSLQAAMNPKKNREALVETMFEKYNFAGVHCAIQAVLTLYAQGLLTGVVVDSCDGVTHVVLID